MQIILQYTTLCMHLSAACIFICIVMEQFICMLGDRNEKSYPYGSTTNCTKPMHFNNVVNTMRGRPQVAQNIACTFQLTKPSTYHRNEKSYPYGSTTNCAMPMHFNNVVNTMQGRPQVAQNIACTFQLNKPSTDRQTDRQTDRHLRSSHHGVISVVEYR